MAALDHYFPTKMAVIASIAADVPFGWALQLSLLTPYIQLLGVPHKWAANTWLCIGGAKRLWEAANVVLAVGLAMTVLITKAAEHGRHHDVSLRKPSTDIKAAALLFFAVLGVRLAVKIYVHCAVCFGQEQGKVKKQLHQLTNTSLYLGVLNISIVTPQILISILSGPLDSLFGGSNLPAFTVGVVEAIISVVLAIARLPTPATEEMANAPIEGGLH